MKILQLVPELNFGGVERGTIDLAIELKQRGYQSLVCSHGGLWVSKLENQNIQHILLPIHKKNPFAILINSFRLRKIIKQKKIDIVHARSRAPAWVGLLATRKTKAHFITTAHGHYSIHFGSLVMALGEKVICVSKEIQNHICNNFNASIDNAPVIYRGIEIQELKNDRKISKYNQWVIGNIGRLTPIKGVLPWLISMKEYLNQHPFQTILIGGGHHPKHQTYKNKIINWIEKHQFQKKIKTLNHVEKIEEFYQSIDVLIVTTTVPEAFGRIIVESQLMKVPVIAPRIGGIPEIIEDGVHGLLYDVGQFEQIPSLIEKLKDEALYQQMTKAAYERAKNKFCSRVMYEKTIQIYLQLIHKKKVLVSKYGSLGDLLCMSATLNSIKKKLGNNAELFLAVEPQYLEVVDKLCHYSKIVFDRKEKQKNIIGYLKWVLRYQIMRFDISIDFQNNHRSQWAHYLMRIPIRYGVLRKWPKRLLTHSIDYRQLPMNPLEQQKEILALLNIERINALKQFEVTDLDLKTWNDLKDKIKLTSKKYIVIHAGSSPDWTSKRWPIENYIQLSKMLYRNLGISSVYVGTKSDYSNAMSHPLNQEGFFNLINLTSIGVLAALMQQALSYVGNDSAPAHLAYLLDKNAYLFFGPTKSQKHLSNLKAILFELELECQPCYQKTCPLNHQNCLTQITPQTVYHQINTDYQIFNKEVS